MAVEDGIERGAVEEEGGGGQTNDNLYHTYYHEYMETE